MAHGPTAADVDPDPDPGALPSAVVETHVSRLFFVDDRVYKLKKAVRFPFVDLTSRAAREALCHREVELNRRLAPDVYLGVADIHGVDGAVCDHLVVMRRLPEHRRLAALVRAGDPEAEGIIDEIARILAAFHRDAERSVAIDEASSLASVEQLWAENFEEIRPFVGPVIDAAAFERAEQLASAFLAGRGALFAERAATGMNVDGHGDLQAEDIFCLGDGPRILDCIEFADRFRFGDVAADLAFLAMDLERLGAPELAERLRAQYERAAGTVLPRGLFDLFVAYRAQVRAKVTCLRAAQQPADAPEHDASVASARALFELCVRHLDAATVRLVVVGGLPGTGKSTVAAGLARRLGFELLRSDVVRKELAGLAETERATSSFEAGLYDPAMTDRVYDELARRARPALDRGRSVVLDASFTAERHRGPVRALAAATASHLVELECVLDATIAAARMRERAAGGVDASDATPEIAAALAAAADPWAEAVRVDGAGTPDEVLGRALVVVAAPADPADPISPGRSSGSGRPAPTS